MPKRPLPDHKIVWRDPDFKTTVDVEFPGFIERVRIIYHRQFGYRYQTAHIGDKEIARAGGWKGIIRAVHTYLVKKRKQERKAFDSLQGYGDQSKW